MKIKALLISSNFLYTMEISYTTMLSRYVHNRPQILGISTIIRFLAHYVWEEPKSFAFLTSLMRFQLLNNQLPTQHLYMPGTGTFWWSWCGYAEVAFLFLSYPACSSTHGLRWTLCPQFLATTSNRPPLSFWDFCCFLLLLELVYFLSFPHPFP
jgi:hypothetical protein